MNRYHIVSGEPDHPSTDQREWNVYDRNEPCNQCSDEKCPGTVVLVTTTRRAARAEVDKLNREALGGRTRDVVLCDLGGTDSVADVDTASPASSTTNEGAV